MSYRLLRDRLHRGRPLVVDADIGAALRARGVDLDCPGALGAVLRKSSDVVREHHGAEVESRVDILSALTADTTPRALAEVGMEHRSAMLTGLAVELALEVAEAGDRPVAVAGVLGSDSVTAMDRCRFEAETREHAVRIAVAGAELIMVRGMGSRVELCYAVGVAAEQELPTWAVVDRELTADADLFQALGDVGAEAVLLEIQSIEEGLERLEAAAHTNQGPAVGVVLAASPAALRGFPEPTVAAWVDRALELTHAGARVIGGGAGTTEAHTQALAAALREIHPSIPPSSIGSALS